MTPHPITWLFDLSPVTLTANAMPPRDPNDDDEEDEEDEKDDHQKDEPAVTEKPPKTNSAESSCSAALFADSWKSSCMPVDWLCCVPHSCDFRLVKRPRCRLVHMPMG